MRALLPSSFLICRWGQCPKLLKALRLLDETNTRVANWPASSVMPPEASEPLKNHVCGRKLGNQEIGVKVNALFNNLSGDKN